MDYNSDNHLVEMHYYFKIVSQSMDLTKKFIVDGRKLYR